MNDKFIDIMFNKKEIKEKFFGHSQFMFFLFPHQKKYLCITKAGSNALGIQKKKWQIWFLPI